MTLTVIVQLPFEGITPAFNLMPSAPAANAVFKLLTSVPPQVFVKTRSAKVIAPGTVGKVSINVAAVNATELLFDKTICKVDVPVFGKIGLVKNALLTVGAANTVISSVAAVPLDATTGPVTVKPPTGMVLSLRPMLVPVITAVTVQEPLAGIVPPESETLVPASDLVPTHVPAAAAAVKPAGSASVNAAPVIAVAVGLLKVMVSVAVPFRAMVPVLKALLILGRATFKVALVPTAFGPMLDVTPPARIALV